MDNKFDLTGKALIIMSAKANTLFRLTRFNQVEAYHKIQVTKFFF